MRTEGVRPVGMTAPGGRGRDRAAHSDPQELGSEKRVGWPVHALGWLTCLDMESIRRT